MNTVSPKGIPCSSAQSVFSGLNQQAKLAAVFRGHEVEQQAAIAPGTTPAMVSSRTMITVPQPRSITARAGRQYTESRADNPL
jgi:hypothetical protein